MSNRSVFILKPKDLKKTKLVWSNDEQAARLSAEECLLKKDNGSATPQFIPNEYTILQGCSCENITSEVEIHNQDDCFINFDYLNQTITLFRDKPEMMSKFLKI